MSIVSLLGPERLRSIALWLLRQLQENLDTDLKARLEVYRKQRETLEEQTKIALAEIRKHEARLSFLQIQRSGLEQSIASREAEIRKLKGEVVHADEEPSKAGNRTGDDVLHADFRR